MVEGAPAGAVKSAMRTLDVLELLVEQAGPMTATEIAGALAIPVSSLSYLLSTLVERAYIERHGRRYAAGPALARLHIRKGQPTLVERAAPLVRTLAHKINETASFFVRQDFEIQAVATETGDHALRYTVSVGQRAPLHSFAAGKALLAVMAVDELETYLAAGGRQAYTPRTLVCETALRNEIAEVRQSGIARTCEEHTTGIIGIGRAASVGGVVVGAFSVAIPVPRYSPEMDRRSVELLSQACDRLGRAADR